MNVCVRVCFQTACVCSVQCAVCTVFRHTRRGTPLNLRYPSQLIKNEDSTPPILDVSVCLSARLFLLSLCLLTPPPPSRLPPFPCLDRACQGSPRHHPLGSSLCHHHDGHCPRKDHFVGLVRCGLILSQLLCSLVFSSVLCSVMPNCLLDGAKCSSFYSPSSYSTFQNLHYVSLPVLASLPQSTRHLPPVLEWNHQLSPRIPFVCQLTMNLFPHVIFKKKLEVHCS